MGSGGLIGARRWESHSQPQVVGMWSELGWRSRPQCFRCSVVVVVVRRDGRRQIENAGQQGKEMRRAWKEERSAREDGKEEKKNTKARTSESSQSKLRRVQKVSSESIL